MDWVGGWIDGGGEIKVEWVEGEGWPGMANEGNISRGKTKGRERMERRSSVWVVVCFLQLLWPLKGETTNSHGARCMVCTIDAPVAQSVSVHSYE